MRPLALALALAALPSLAVAQSLKTVKVDYDDKVDFSRYKTFAWSEAQELAENPANHIRVTRAVERELQGKGLQMAAEGAAPDLRIRYYAKIEKKLKSTSHQQTGAWEPNNLRTMVDISRVAQGTLILELSDGESRDVVWRGVNTDTAPRADLVAEAIDQYVKKIVAAYPPKPKAAP